MNKRPPQKGPPACPCGSSQSYAICCGKYHHGTQRLMAPDPQALMRSRYSAFVLDEIDYVLETWHPDTRPSEVERNEPGTKWLGLKVISHKLIDADQGHVEFVARMRNPQGKALRIHENSRFIRVNGHWLYVDGEILD